MDSNDAAADPGFEDLTSYKSVAAPKERLHGNVIKAEHLVFKGILQVGVAEGSTDQPTVTIHRHGEIIESAEFSCRCGRAATLKFEYEGE